MASAIKIEVDQIYSQSFCHGCLSQDRKLKPLTGENNKVFNLLMASGTLFDSDERMICWECEAILRRVIKFGYQICLAQNKLMEMFYIKSPYKQTLSNLSTITKEYYDLYCEYIEETYVQTEPIFENNYILPETIHESTHTTVLPPITNSSVKIEKFKTESETSLYSDYDKGFNNDDSNNYEIKNTPSENESTNLNKQINNTISKRDETPRLKNCILKKPSHDYLKYAKIKTINTKFEKSKSYFVKECLDLEQVENFIVKQDPSLNWYKCQECKLSLKEKTFYLLHQNLAHFKPGSSTTCLKCKKRLRNLEKLRSHWKYTHCALWRCNLCNSYCKKAGRLRHLNKQHTKVYCCTKCHGEFRSQRFFSIHFKKEHDKYICHHCGKVCLTKSHIIKHLVTHSDTHICEICNKNYKTRYRLTRHIKVYHPESINKKVDTEAAYCVECNKQYQSVERFKKHLIESRKHNSKAPVSVPCPECGKIFSRKSYMKNHLHFAHMREKAKWKCTICEKYFTNNWGLKLHVKRVHLKIPRVKDQICDICGRAFNEKQILIKHRRTHTGERPYKCGYCSASFAQRTAMTTHQKTQHKDVLQSSLN